MSAQPKPNSVVFEFVDPYKNTITRSPPFKARCDNFLLSPQDMFELMGDNSEEKFSKEIDVFALVPSNKQDCEDTDDLFELLEEKRKNTIPDVKISPLIVSTQSAKAKLAYPIDLKRFSEVLKEDIEDKIDAGSQPNFSIRGILYNDIHAGEIKIPKKNKAGQFPNNCSVLIRSPMGTGRKINLKIFLKGSITMTGCLIKEDGISAIRILEQYLLKKKELIKDKFNISGFETTMVNSNYSLGFKVDRDLLYSYLTKNTQLNVSYSPDKYAGVKISFYYNTFKDVQDGICKCSGFPCTGDKATAGKGNGKEEGQCKRVTIAVFESGEVINTGGRTLEQAEIAYEYINGIFMKNAKEFVKVSLEDII